MKKRNLIIAVICLAALLVGCGQAPASPASENPTLDVRLESQTTVPPVTELASDAVQTEATVVETETALITEPVQEPESTAQSEETQPAESKPQSEPAAGTTPTNPAQSNPKEDPKPTEPAAPPTTTEPKPTDPKPTESAPTQPTEPQTPPPATEPTEPVTEPTTEPPTEEPPTQPPAPEIDISALEAYGNQYAASLGFEIDYSMNAGNSGFFPPNSAMLNSMSDGYRLVSEQVAVTRDYLMAYVGNIDGARCRVLVAKDNNGWYTCTVLYG